MKFGGVLRKFLFIASACTGSLLWATPPGLNFVISPVADNNTLFRLDVSGTADTVLDDGAQAGGITFDNSPTIPFADYGSNSTTNLVFGGQAISYFGTQGIDTLFFVFDTGSVPAGSSYSFATDYALGTTSSGYEATFVPGTYSILYGSGIFGDGPIGSLTILSSPIPEPATYAALAGVAVLGFGVWRRRRA